MPTISQSPRSHHTHAPTSSALLLMPTSWMWTLLGILTQIYPWMKMHLLPRNRRNRSQTHAKTNTPKGQVLLLAFLLNIFSLHMLDPEAVDADGFLTDIQVYDIEINKRLCDDKTRD